MAKTLPTKFLDADILRSISDAELRARLLVQGMYASRRPSLSVLRGYSVEFVDHREYTTGDEPRTIDWKMYARTDRYYVKRFEMESNMNVLCMFDVSGSMGYRSADKSRLTKIEYGSYLLCRPVSPGDPSTGGFSTGLVTSADQDVRDFIPPKQGKRHLFTILSRFDALVGKSGTQINTVPAFDRSAIQTPGNRRDDERLQHGRRPGDGRRPPAAGAGARRHPDAPAGCR